MKEIYITIYTKEFGKLELTKKEWYFSDENITYHREDGPACIWDNGSESYWFDGKPHREDGPAVIGFNGRKLHYLNGIYYTKEEYHKKLEEIDNLPLSLKLTHEEEWIRKRAKK